MCDHCVKRERAYDALDSEDKAAVDTFTAQAEPTLGELVMANDREAFETAYLSFGDNLDLLLGIASPAIPDTPPANWVG